MSSKSAEWDAARRIAVVAYDGVKLMDVAGPLQAFNDARFDDGRSAYDVSLVSETGGPVTTDTGVTLETVRLDDAALDLVDTLLIAGGEAVVPPNAPSLTLRNALAEYLDRPRRLGSICTGAFVLAGLGVLDGRDVTTHWGACDLLQRGYPLVTVKPDAIFVISDRIWTSAGVSAG